MELIRCSACLSSNVFEQITNDYHCNDCYNVFGDSMSNLKQSGKEYSDEEILEYAKYIAEKDLANHGYPIWPIDDFGNPDTSDGPGCVPWCIVTEYEVTEAEIYERKEDEVLVIVTLNLKWQDGSNDYEEIEEDEADFLVTVYTDDSELSDGGIERFD